MDTAADRPVRIVPFSRPSLGREELDEVLATLESGWLTTGPRVRQFERDFAAYIGTHHAVALNSCTAALHLALLAAGIGPGDEVITTPLTFCATANTIVQVGAVPVFADIDPETWNLSPTAAAAAITPRTRALLPVHYAGRPVDVQAFRDLAERHGLTVIEDAAHCAEGMVDGRRIGTTADYTCFSFYATKNLTTGEGGMLVTTAGANVVDRIRVMSLHGMSRDAWSRYENLGSIEYDVVAPGYKYNMMDLQAAIGLHQLKRLERNLLHRESLWADYDGGLADLPLTRPAPPATNTRHARHLYTVLVVPGDAGIDRAGLGAALAARGIGTSVHFRALHLHSYYASRFGLRRGQFPHAEHVSDHTLSLPLSAGLTSADSAYVVDVLHDVLGRRNPA